MLFSSITFLFFFLPASIILYYIAPQKMRNYVLLTFSIAFYAWGGLAYLPLLLISIAMNYVLGLAIDKYKERPKTRKGVLFLTIFLNVLFLGIFKYTNFIVDNVNAALQLDISVPTIPLPIGISFYTFQAMSYVIDVYRGDGKVQRNPFNLALYISMFPQLVAGPIVRYETVAEQLKKRVHSMERFHEGMQRFIIGLFKKVVISNSIGEMHSYVIGMGDGEMSIATAWLGALAYALQIYFDFSGYSDMAIGLGKIFGFDFLENFNYPYIAKSVSEFWRRWHISLGSWFRDYIYIPLGGNRVRESTMLRNLLVVWFITGVWHGANWTFIFWGLYFGIFIILERFVIGKLLTKLFVPLQHAYLIIIVLFGWVLFAAPNATEAITYIKIMLGFGNYPLVNSYTTFLLEQWGFIIILAVIGSTPIMKNMMEKETVVIRTTQPVIAVSMFFVTIVYLLNSTFNPFIYFNF